MDHPESQGRPRVACPWLIKKFVDKDADSWSCRVEKCGEAKRSTAIPYTSVNDFGFGQSRQGNAREAILKKVQAAPDPALVLLGRIVNGADTDKQRVTISRKGPRLEAVAEFPASRLQDDHEHNAASDRLRRALCVLLRDGPRGKPNGDFMN